MRKKALPRAIPPPLELECLRALWTLEAANVAQVREALLSRHPLAYTTVMTLLDRLARKGAAQRKKSGRYFVYSPAVDRETLRRAAVGELVDHYFDGSEDQMRAWLGGVPNGEAAAMATPAAESGDDLETVLL
jgi:predicted transcriptional regulator